MRTFPKIGSLRVRAYSGRVEFRTIRQAFSVSYEYPVVFTHGLFSPANKTLEEVAGRLGEQRRHRIVAFIDDGMAEVRPGLASEIEACFAARPSVFELVAPPRPVPGGERCKNNAQVISDMLAVLAVNKMDRHSFVLAVGGGAVLDGVGFATALFHRGLRLIRVPTTVLAQNDAGVGVKNAINFLQTKNLLGTFAPPFAVLNDLDFLRTLPDTAWTDGIAEAFKVAIIKDEPFFLRLCDLAPRLKARDGTAMEELVFRCAELHLEHIRSNGDPFEFGRARPLDFGHWSAHKLEQMSDYAVSHGAAVAIGIALDSFYAMRRKWITSGQFEAVHDGLCRAGFSLWNDLLERRGGDGSFEILSGLREFQEHLGGDLCVTMPRGLGAKFEIHEMDRGLIEEAIEELKARAGAPATGDQMPAG